MMRDCIRLDMCVFAVILFAVIYLQHDVLHTLYYDVFDFMILDGQLSRFGRARRKVNKKQYVVSTPARVRVCVALCPLQSFRLLKKKKMVQRFRAFVLRIGNSVLSVVERYFFFNSQ